MAPNTTHKGKKYGLSKTGYYIRSEPLHIRVWEDLHGPIPEGMVIHHINGDKTDNNIDNLVCLTRRDHGLIHPGRHSPLSEKEIEALRNRVKKTWKNTPYRLLICEHCGNEFETRCPRKTRFCSQKCASNAEYRRRKIIERCQLCGSEFLTDSKRPGKACSHKCAALLLSQQRSKAPKLIHCAECGGGFLSKAARERFCSKKCANKSYNRARRRRK